MVHLLISAMRLYRRCYTGILLAIICILAILKIYNIHQMRRKYSVRSIATINPSSKQHWFRLKITEKNNKPVERKQKRILLWTKFFGEPNYIPPLETLYCAEKNCIVTSNRSYLSQSDALIFHLRDTSLSDMPVIKQQFQRWILLHHEAPPNTPSILKFLDGLFNWTATYRLDSDIFLSPIVKKRQKILKNLPNFARSKTRMVAWFVSNCETNGNREGFVKELQKSISIDVYGDCGDKVCLPKMSDECYKKIALEYRYYLAFENSLCKDYVTEKFFNVLHTDMVPIVFGGANYSEIAPPGSYIDALSYDSPRELANFLRSVAKNPPKYNSYFEWKKLYELVVEPYACQICRKLHEPSKPTWRDDIHQWWFVDGDCKRWSQNF